MFALLDLFFQFLEIRNDRYLTSSFPSAAHFRPAVKREIVGLWHVLQNPSRPLR